MVSVWWQGKPLPWAHRLLLFMALTLVVSMVEIPASQTPAVAAPAAPAQAACPAERADEAAALVTARVCAGKVQISSATSETSRAWALPTGSVEREISAAPVRVRQGADWVPVDLEMEARPDGTVGPKAHPRSLTVSGRQTTTGVHALAELGAGANVAALGWSGPLPQPTIAANKATYAEVRPGVDLVVEATVTGVESFYVVKTRDAAKEVAELTLSVTGTLVASHRRAADGAVTLLDAKGRTVATSPAPLMWDARLDANTRAPAHMRAVGSAAAARKARVEGPKAKAIDGAGVDLTLTPDAKFLADPATVYPVTIDPQLTLDDPTWDTWVREGTTTDLSTTGFLQIGAWSGAGSIARSFVNFDVSALKGKYINSATTGFFNYSSNTCTNVDWEIWSVNASDTNTRWTNQPTWKTKEGQSSATKGGPNDCIADGTVYIDSKQYFQRQADEQRNIGYMGVRATDETNTAAGKNFYSQNYTDVTKSPFAIINYSSFPTTSALATSPSTPCVTGTARPYVNTATPLLQARVTDPDGASVRPEFAWSTTAGTAIGTAQPTPGKASGALFATTVPAGAFANNGNYSWKVRGYDGTVWGPWSAACEFTVDTTAPSAAPSVSSTTYPENTWSAAAGTAGTFTFGASSVTDVASYVYGLDTDNPTSTVNPATLGGTASVSITPASDGPHTLSVRSRDRAGNLSPVTRYVFNVGAGAVISPQTGDMSAGKVALQGQGRPTTSGVTFEWRRGDADTWITVPSADVTLAAGGAAITWPVATTGSGAYPKLTWNLDQTLNNAEAGLDPLDGPVQIRASFTGTTTGTSTAVKASLDRNQASAASELVGPGSVNLLTGNYTLSDTDVSVDAYGSDLTVTRSYNTRRATAVDSANMFGPGWVSSAVVENAEAPYTRLNRTGSLVQVGLPDGNSMAFAARTSTAFDPEPGLENLKLTYNSTTDAYTLADESGTSVTFSRVTGSPVGTYHPTSVTQPGSGQTTTLTWAKVTVAGVDLYRPTRMLAPVPSGVTSCTTLVQGCRALNITYATVTTATGTTTTTWGDYLGRVKEISFTAWDPDLATPAMRTVVMARYSYDNTGKLRFTWDPRLDYTNGSGAQRVGDTYDYNTDGILATITPAGQQPWQLTYTTIPGDTGKGRLAAVTRSALTAGTATTTVVYKIPIGNTGPHDLSAAQTVRWGQAEQPVDATAIYPATQVPDGNQATGVLPSSAERATVTYLDANGRAVNTAVPSGHISTTWYDRYGNNIRSLDGRNLERVLYASETDTAAQEAEMAARLSTVNTYSNDGQQLLDTLGPEHDVILPDFSSVRGRTHTRNTYDEGAPTGGPYNLVTTSTTTVRYTVNGVDTDADARTTATDYNWTLRQPTSSTVDPGGLNLVTRTAYDSTTGLVTSTTAPAGGTSTTTPSTRVTVYYRAGTGSGHTECDSKPHWANLPCRVQPGGQPTTGAQLPATVTTYDMLNQPRTVTEKTSTTTLRTTTTTYDTAGRASETVTTATGLGTSTPTRRNVYEQATGQHTKTQSVVSGSVTAEVIRGYDTLGRQTSYTDADGAASTTTYDILGRPATSNDGKATRTYTYDSGAERRGLLTQVVDSQAGTFTASYDGAGKVTRHTWPTGVTTNQYYDETGEATGIEYLATSSCTTAACTLYSDYIGKDAHDLNRWDANSLDSFGYTYDDAGRLTDVAHTTTGGCILREYTFDTASNRTGLADYGPEPGACSDSTPIGSRTWAYDSANRATNTGYTYDALGRTLTVPNADSSNSGGDITVTYHNTDLVDTITQNGRTTDYTLDVTGERIRSWTDTTTGSTARLHHYDGDDDNPSWTQESTTAYTRPLAGIAGMAGIYTSSTATINYQITNLHGDVAATIQGNDTGLTTTQTASEYGTPTNLTNVGTIRYGWLGSHQRAADTPAGIILMGVRLYNTSTGRFLQVDPVPGGSCNEYEYSCGDGVNKTDLDGKHCWWRWGCRTWRQTRYVSRHSWGRYRSDWRQNQGCYYATSGYNCPRVRRLRHGIVNYWGSMARRTWGNGYVRSCTSGAGITYGTDAIKKGRWRGGRLGWSAVAGCAGGIAYRFARNRGWV